MLNKYSKGIFKDDLITNLLNAKIRIYNKGKKYYKNKSIKKYCDNKFNLLGI